MPVTYLHRILSSPKKIQLSQAIKLKTRITKKTIDEQVKIIESYVKGHNYLEGIGSHVVGSIVNHTYNYIKNIRIVIVFYPTEYVRSKKVQKGNDPLHYMLVDVKDTIPPGLAVRFRKYEDNLSQYWIAKFRVIDYDILERSASGVAIPAFE